MENVSRLLHSHTDNFDTDSQLIDPGDHDRVLATCVDIPEEVPSFPIEINDVGISNKTVWVALPDGRTPFDVVITVNLPGTSRGIHMSRMEGAISSLHGNEYDDIGLYAEALAQKIAQEQAGNKATVRLSGKLPWIKTTAASKRQSVDAVSVGVESVYTKDDATPFSTTLSVAMDHITACPCTQAYNEVLFNAPPTRVQPTHSQRSTTELKVQRSGASPSVHDLVSCLKAALHTTSDLLKRTDEAEIVLKSHRNPQFAEDTSRETARAVGQLLGGLLPPETEVQISSLSLESIHTHDVQCSIQTTMGGILAVTS